MMIASLKDPLANNENARVKRLEKGRTELKEEIKQLQRYIEHIDEWFGTVGKWNVEIANIDLTESDGYDKDPLMILVIYRPDSGYDSNQRDTDGDFPSISSTNSEKSYNYEEPLSDDMEVISLSSGEFIPKSAGWVLGRRLSEFQNLHQKICQVNDNIIFPPLPKKFSFAFNRKDSEKKYWESYCKALEAYINRVIQDPKMVESEEIFNFLSPASADMHKDTKTSRLLLREAKVDETILDSISSLVTEVFDLHERSRLLRRQIYELAQLTFGHGMEGELQDLMKWIVSEPMLVHYIEVFKESMWPGGQLGEPNIDRMDEEKEKTKEEAKDRFMKCAPQTLQTLLGQRNCQIGLLKMFTAFQDRNANKQLLYSFLELLMYALVPELNHVEVDSTSE
jgi:sorting nexin-25